MLFMCDSYTLPSLFDAAQLIQSVDWFHFNSERKKEKKVSTQFYFAGGNLEKWFIGKSPNDLSPFYKHDFNSRTDIEDPEIIVKIDIRCLRFGFFCILRLPFFQWNIFAMQFEQRDCNSGFNSICTQQVKFNQLKLVRYKMCLSLINYLIHEQMNWTLK